MHFSQIRIEGICLGGHHLYFYPTDNAGKPWQRGSLHKVTVLPGCVVCPKTAPQDQNDLVSLGAENPSSPELH